jgi:hypothetical protein
VGSKSIRQNGGWMHPRLSVPFVVMLDGSCHCGDISLRFETERDPAELPVTVCGCTFCLKHRPRFTNDPTGSLAISYKDEALGRYRFALRLADFLICRTCGVFVCTFLDQRACINLEALQRATEFTATPNRFTAYSSETADVRRARWAKEWTPAMLVPR